MNIRWTAILLTIIIATTSLMGCWSRTELNELGIVVGLGLDRIGDQYLITTQVIDASQIASQKRDALNAPITIFQEKGNSLFEAFRKITMKSPKRLYHSYLRVVIIGEGLAKSGLSESLDFLARDHEFRRDFFLVIAKGNRAASITKILTPIVSIPANKMFYSLLSSERELGITRSETLDEVLLNLGSKGNQLVLSTVKLKGPISKGITMENIRKSTPPSSIQYNGSAVFKNDQLIGWLNEQESKGLNYIQNRIRSTVVKVTCSKNRVLGIEQLQSKTNMDVSIKNNKPVGYIVIRAEGNVGEVQCRQDFTKEQTIQQLERKAEQSIKQIVDAVIKKSQKRLQVDYLGFGGLLYQTNPASWKEMKDQWDQKYYREMPIHLKVTFKIRSLGSTTKSIVDMMEGRK